MRDDERLVMEALAAKYSGRPREGEDPPDAYLLVGSAEIGVEISTLSQYVGGSATLRPRRSDDVATYRLVKELNSELGDLIPPGSTISLVLSSPIIKLRKTKAALTEILRERASSLDCLLGEEKIVIYGNKIKLFHNRHGAAGYDRISPVFMNRDSSPDVLTNAHVALDDRIWQKAEKCRNVPHRPLWLALLNDDGFTEPYVYQMALGRISAPHPFGKILIVSRAGEVVAIFERGGDPAPQ